MRQAQMNSKIRIGNRTVGQDEPCFVIAEAGSNHDGKLDQALQLVDIAAKSGADAVKFQNFKADKLYLKNAGISAYLKTTQSIYDIIKKMEMPDEWVPVIAEHCAKRGIIFLSSPFDEQSADLLEPYVPAYKIASYEMTATPLVQYIAKKGRPLFMSTGTSNLDEVRDAVCAVQSSGNHDLILMQCTASYPAPLKAMNLKAIVTMRNELGVPVGLSDHSKEWDIAPAAAVALGAVCIEKHFTLSNKLEGPDHKFAIEPQGLSDMVGLIRKTEQSLGSGIKQMLPEEAELHSFARRGIFAIKNIKKGERFSRENIGLLRCGEQKAFLRPASFEKLLSQISGCDIAVNEAIREEHLSQKP